MKKFLIKINNNEQWHVVFSILAIILLLGLYSLIGFPLSFAVSMKINDGDTDIFNQYALEIVYLLLFVAITILAIVLYHFLTGKKILEKITKKNVLFSISIFVTSIVLQLVLSTLDATFFGNSQTANNEEIQQIMSLRFDFAGLIFFTAVFITPIFEEIIYRGLIMDGIFRKYRVVGIFVQAIVFASSHSTDNFLQFLTFLVTGLGLGTIFWKTKSLQYSICGHFIQNLFAGISLLINIFG